MAWHAIDSVEPAADRTANLLFTPFNLKFWLKLALVAFLMGSGGGGMNFGGYNTGGGDFNDGGFEESFDNLNIWIMNNIGFIAAVIGIIILIALLLWYISTVMYFVFLESVIKSKVEIIDGFKRYTDKGFWVFLFEIAVLAVFILCMAIPALIYYFIFGISFGPGLWLFLVFGVFAMILILIFMMIISSFTIDFVVPYMYKGRGVIKGWKHLVSILRKNIGQIIFYMLMKVLLVIVAVILGFIIAIILLLILAIPGIIIVFLAIAIGSAIGLSGICSGSLLPVCIAVAIIIFIALILIIGYLMTLATLPIPVFFRYYSLKFLMKIDEEFIIPELEEITPEK